MPDFNGRDRNFRMFRTRVTDAIKMGPNFAGHYAIVQMGCGTDCVFTLLADVATGKVYNFPLGGDAYMSLDLKYRLQSSLIIARWVQNRRCFQEYLIWKGESFTSLGKHDVGVEAACR